MRDAGCASSDLISRFLHQHVQHLIELGFCRKPQRRSFETISRSMSQVPPRVQSAAPLLPGSPGGSPCPSQEEGAAGQKKSWRRRLHLPSRAQRSSGQASQKWVPECAAAAASASLWCCC